MPALTRDDILAINDISVKEITIPDTIPVWGGNTLFIRQLTRGQQDLYLKRQFGSIRAQQDQRAKKQELSDVQIYGHDAWIFVQGVVNENGKPMFKESDIPNLNAKSGEAIGWVASEIIKFSGMALDEKVAKGEIEPEEVMKDEVKN